MRDRLRRKIIELALEYRRRGDGEFARLATDLAGVAGLDIPGDSVGNSAVRDCDIADARREQRRLTLRGPSYELAVEEQVIDLDASRKIWSNWWAACTACGKTWVDSVPHPCPAFLECPGCHMRGVRTAPAEQEG